MHEDKNRRHFIWTASLVNTLNTAHKFIYFFLVKVTFLWYVCNYSSQEVWNLEIFLCFYIIN